MNFYNATAPRTVTPTSLESRVASCRKALSRLKLSRPDARGARVAPWQVEGKGLLKEPRTYCIVEPRETGKSPAQLVDHFVKGSEGPSPKDFAHYRIDEDRANREKPFYASARAIAPWSFVNSGTPPGLNSQRHSLLAKMSPEEDAPLLGYVTFELSLLRFEDVEDEDDLVDEEDARTLCLLVDLMEIYVLPQHRGEGVGTALVESMATRIDDELKHLARALHPTFMSTGQKFNVRPEIVSSWQSFAGKLAHEMLRERLQDMIGAHTDVATYEQVRMALQLHPVLDHDATY